MPQISLSQFTINFKQAAVSPPFVPILGDIIRCCPIKRTILQIYDEASLTGDSRSIKTRCNTAIFVHSSHGKIAKDTEPISNVTSPNNVLPFPKTLSNSESPKPYRELFK